MAKCEKQVVRLSAEQQAIVAAWKEKKGFSSLSEATDDLVMYAHNRLEALRRDGERRLKEAAAR